MYPIQLAVSALVLIAASHFFDPIHVRGSDVDELRERAANMHREVAELIERGHEQEADELRMKADTVLQQADRLQDRQRDSHRSRMIESLAEKLQDLRDEERNLQKLDGHDERLDDVRAGIAHLKRQLREYSERRGDPAYREQPEAVRRLKHMRMAIEHLSQAGLHDEARHVARRAEEAEHRMHRNQGHQSEQHAEIARALEEVRSEVRRLRDQVDQLMDEGSSIGRESDRRPKPRKVERDPPRRQTSPSRDRDSDQEDKGGRGRDRREQEG